jgi:uncharacterized protein DUF4158/Tn3 transposase DDE domain-containing protein
VPHEYLSEDQTLRYRRFVDDPSPGELELFFRMDAATVAQVQSKRRSYNRLGWSVQWGTVRMLGTFLSTPAEVPDVVTRFMAEQLDIDDPTCLKLYPDRLPTQHEHAREIRDLLRYRDFAEGELELRSYVASRVWNSVESRRALFDRAVVWLLRNRVLLPGISVLSRLVTEVRAGEYEWIHGLIAAAPPAELAETLIGLLEVPEGRHVSELERLRTTVHSISGPGVKLALDRVDEVCELKTGEVDLSWIPLVKQAELARYGMACKAPTIRGLTEQRRTATMLATVRHLEGAAVDDALLLFDALMTTKLLARAERLSTTEKLRTLPRFRKAAGVVATVLAALWDVAEADEELAAQAEADGVAAERVYLSQAWEQIEQVAGREEVAKALATVVEMVPDADEDDDAAWRAQLVSRYPTVRGVLEPLATVIPWGATAAGAPVVAALRALPGVLARRPPGAEHVAEEIVTGSWRRLVYGNPDLPPPQIDRAAYTFCVLEVLWRALRRRDVYAHGADRWGDPRARLLDDTAWGIARPRVLTALGLPADPAERLDELARDLDAVYRQVADGLPANAAVRIGAGRIELDRLGSEPEPPGMQAVRDAVAGMLPRIDYPELILEVNARTGMFDGFTHITGTDARLEDLDISLAGVLVSESCNVGLVPVVKMGVKALTQARLLGWTGPTSGPSASAPPPPSWSSPRPASTSPGTGVAGWWLRPTECGLSSRSARCTPGRTRNISGYRNGELGPRGSTSSRTGSWVWVGWSFRAPSATRSTFWTPFTISTCPTAPSRSSPIPPHTATLSLVCSRSAGTSSPPGSPTSATPGCGGSPPSGNRNRATASSTSWPGTPSSWPPSGSGGTTCCGLPGPWSPARSGPTT